MVKVFLSGCCGKMGHMVVDTSKKITDIQIVGGLDFSLDSSYDFPVCSDINNCNPDFDVILDFSRPDSLNGLLSYCLKFNRPLVLCTTGYNNEQIQKINEYSKKIPIFKSANMSLGVNIVNSLLRNISSILYDDFDIEIIEKHHNQKVDSPSGTAVMLANTIKASLDTPTDYVFGREGNHKRVHNEIGIHSVRGGTIVGEHEVIFAGTGETITIKHEALSREVFAVGALKACKYILTKTEGIYTMDDMLSK